MTRHSGQERGQRAARRHVLAHFLTKTVRAADRLLLDHIELDNPVAHHFFQEPALAADCTAVTGFDTMVKQCAVALRG